MKINIRKLIFGKYILSLRSEIDEKRTEIIDLKLANDSLRNSIKTLEDDKKDCLERIRKQSREIHELNCIIAIYKDKLIPKKTIIHYHCVYCGFEGKDYHDFCPGCGKDSKGYDQKHYKSISSKSPTYFFGQK